MLQRGDSVRNWCIRARDAGCLAVRLWQKNNAHREFSPAGQNICVVSFFCLDVRQMCGHTHLQTQRQTAPLVQHTGTSDDITERWHRNSYAGDWKLRELSTNVNCRVHWGRVSRPWTTLTAQLVSKVIFNWRLQTKNLWEEFTQVKRWEVDFTTVRLISAVLYPEASQARLYVWIINCVKT